MSKWLWRLVVMPVAFVMGLVQLLFRKLRIL